ncbi:ATP-binding protein [Dyadobacter sp. CY343]|uniref:ATP-binding protein n=1 Tax=Dyadobacter sp. CY343 TaxID=2907299 RepID=UPI001F48846B|nr:ATP-binding protein [Dyadobacter sp. CY343]MCE7060653.1 ATP-binding protein [Dyadobacter sp. CY343]
MALYPFSETQIIARLQFENPWWTTGKLDAYYASFKPRLYFDLFYPLIKNTTVHRAAVLMGPRRVGKTVMLYHTIQQLIRDGVAPTKILYASIETPIYNNIPLSDLFAMAKKASGNADDSGWYIIYDEIQYLKDWEVHLKTLVDTFHQTKFIASGSAAAALKLKSNESGAGRFTDFMLPPLTFHEYIHLKDLAQLIRPDTINWKGNIGAFSAASNITELNRHFIEYVNFGGYPEVIFNEEIQGNPGRFMRADIIDKVLLRDLPGLYGIQDVQELNSLFTTIAWNSGQECSIDELSKKSGVKKTILRQYLTYLEAAFLVHLVKRVDQKAGRFQRENFFKIYLTNPSLRSALFAPLTAEADGMGAIVETAIFSQWMQRTSFIPYYGRWKNGEVDLVSISRKNNKPNWAVEIKWSNRYFEAPNELKSLTSFCQENGLNQALATTIDKTGLKKSNDIQIQFIPASVYAYNVGKNTLESQK